MMKFLQIVFVIVAVLWTEAYGTPLFQGISFQRGFELNFKPLPRKPITFLKEKWSPFGIFGRKHVIQKRNSGSVVVPVEHASPVPLVAIPMPRPAAPVFEHVEESHLHTPPIITLPNQTPRSVVPLLISSPALPLGSPIPAQPISPGSPIVSSPVPPAMPLSVIVTPAPPRPLLNNVPPSSISTDMIRVHANQPIANDLPLRYPTESRIPPISSNMVIPPRHGLYTDISRAEPVKEFMESKQHIPPPVAVEEKVAPPLETNSIKPEVPKSEFVLNDSSLVRGSKFALYFGSIFLQLMSQFMSNARATFDQMTNPPPVYNNN